jgi:hypothetical protein
MYMAAAGDKTFDNDILLEAVNRITPTSETRKADIDEIRELKKQGFYPANEEGQSGTTSFGRKINV